MSASSDPTFPPHALRIWLHARQIFVSYPSAAGNGPMVVAYDDNTTALHGILSAMREADADAHPLPTPHLTASTPTVRAAPGQRKGHAPAANLSDDDRRHALAALIAAGILPPTSGN